MSGTSLDKRRNS